MSRLLDLSGQRFGRLVAVSRVDGRWLCRCDCGETKLVFVRHLRSGVTNSCGCIRIERGRAMTDRIQLGRDAQSAMRHHGTAIYAIRSKKPFSNSTTGVRGVSFTPSGRYRAYLTLQQQQKFLGDYDTLEEAKQARKDGEEKYYAPVIESFERDVACKLQIEGGDINVN